MQTLRAMRRSSGLTFLDLARLSGISARVIAEAEYGLRPLSPFESEALCFIFGLPANAIGGQKSAAPIAKKLPMAQMLITAALGATLATASLQQGIGAGAAPMTLAAKMAPELAAAAGSSGALANLQAQPVAAAAEQLYALMLAELAALPQPEPLSPALVLGQPPALPASPAPLFTLSENGPLGCPVQPSSGRVVLTQGYGVGSHAPANIWGAIDLAVDGNNDGYAEPGASWYAPIVATHTGIATVTPNSSPGGNHVWISDPASPWKTGYAHLALVMVSSGQYVQAGEVIGLLGNTGMASGPHLDYQVWKGNVNIDPTTLVGCK